MAETKQKVYCNSCKHLYKNNAQVICEHPDNYIMLDGNWLQPSHKVNGKTPEDINKNNDCGWYQEKQ